MYKMSIQYEDYDGNKRKEDCYFNLSKTELTKMQLSESGGLDKVLARIIQEQDITKIADLLDTVILKSYGIKSDDGKTFSKSAEISEKFKSTQAYDELFMKLISDPQEAANFIKKIIPSDLSAKIPNDVSKLPAEVTDILPQ